MRCEGKAGRTRGAWPLAGVRASVSRTSWVDIRCPDDVYSSTRRRNLNWVAAGIVEDDPEEEEHIGAEASTNNTGELSRVGPTLWALKRAATHQRG